MVMRAVPLTLLENDGCHASAYRGNNAEETRDARDRHSGTPAVHSCRVERRLSTSSNDLIVFTVVTDPEPHHISTVFYSDRSVMNANPCRPKSTYFFEMN